eukprot:TRINITY_DN3016_c0_g4_i1.p1 TRINITY_DN3016_c0_g4~~TRINITY_DN3016_c0_g4_i1.p1  ORF type:complete len:969 (+),score=240.43 TRINITY_DN3016_c0_g4_i1:102-3008(+)
MLGPPKPTQNRNMSNNWQFVQTRVMGLLAKRKKERDEVACVDDVTDRAAFQPPITMDALRENDRLERAKDEKESKQSAGLRGTTNIKPLRLMQQRGSVNSSVQSFGSNRSLGGLRQGSISGTPMKGGLFRHPTKLLRRRKASLAGTENGNEHGEPSPSHGPRYKPAPFREVETVDNSGPASNDALRRLEKRVEKSHAKILEAIVLLSKGEALNVKQDVARERSESCASSASVQSVPVPLPDASPSHKPRATHKHSHSTKLPKPAPTGQKNTSSGGDGNDLTNDLMGLLEDGSTKEGKSRPSQSTGTAEDGPPSGPQEPNEGQHGESITMAINDATLLTANANQRPVVEVTDRKVSAKKRRSQGQLSYHSGLKMSFAEGSQSAYEQSDPDSVPPSYLMDDFDEQPSLLPDSRFRRVWDCSYLVFLLYDVFLWLLAVFTIDGGDVVISHTPAMLAVRILITIFWFVDVYIQARTSRLEGFNFIDAPEELLDRYKWSGAFFIDILASLPMDTIAFCVHQAVGDDVATIGYHLMAPRMLRLIRVHQLFRQSSPTANSPGWIEVVLSTFYLTVFVQFSTCFWLAFATLDEQLLTRPVKDDPWGAYSQALYFIITALTSVGFGDISPTSIGMKYYISFINIVGALLLIVGGGRAGAVFITTDPYELDVCERKRRLEYLMERNDVPWATQREAFKVYPVIVEASIRDYGTILSDLPEYVQDQITYHVKRKVLKKVPMFSSLSAQGACLLAWKLEEFFVRPKEYIIRAGDDGEEMFFLASGVVEVIAREANGDEHWTANLTDGSWFGEIALLKKTKRIASVRTLTRCALYRLHKYDFDRVCNVCVELKQIMEQETARRVNFIKHQISNMSLDLGAAASPRPQAHSRHHSNGENPPSPLPGGFADHSVPTDTSFHLPGMDVRAHMNLPPNAPEPPPKMGLQQEDQVLTFRASDDSNRSHPKPIPTEDAITEGSSSEG